MRVVQACVLLAAVAGCLLLSGCETSTKLGEMFALTKPGDAGAQADAAAPATTGSVPTDGSAPGSGLLGSDPNDDLSLGKKHFRAANFGLAERHFRRAVEMHPLDAESWVGLAASYDRLRRFELADRAYAQATTLVGRTPELLNNQGYSYLLRGDYIRARSTLRAAQVKDPDSPYIQNNLELLEQSVRSRKGIQ
jgi:tetratricopeptide (TPR) repeat protein